MMMVAYAMIKTCIVHVVVDFQAQDQSIIWIVRTACKISLCSACCPNFLSFSFGFHRIVRKVSKLLFVLLVVAVGPPRQATRPFPEQNPHFSICAWYHVFLNFTLLAIFRISKFGIPNSATLGLTSTVWSVGAMFKTLHFLPLLLSSLI
jgi:hypothetical protein